MQSNLHRTRIQRLAAIAAPIALALVFTISTADAANVRLKGATATTTGTVRIKIDDLGACSDFLGIDVTFAGTKRNFDSFTHESRKFVGTYKQSGKDKRAVSFSFDSKSKKKLKSDIKSALKVCARARNVSVNVSKIKITGDINRAQDFITLKGSAKVKGRADGQSGKAKYSFRTRGRLNLVR